MVHSNNREIQGKLACDVGWDQSRQTFLQPHGTLSTKQSIMHYLLNATVTVKAKDALGSQVRAQAGAEAQPHNLVTSLGLKATDTTKKSSHLRDEGSQNTVCTSAQSGSIHYTNSDDKNKHFKKTFENIKVDH